MFRVKDYLNNGNEYDHFFTVRRKRILVDLFHSNIKDFIKDSCFYYSSSADATPIIGCLEITNRFIYCDIQESSNFNDSLHKLKSRLKEHHNSEICYCTLEPEWFGLNKEIYRGHYRLKYDDYFAPY